MMRSYAKKIVALLLALAVMIPVGVITAFSATPYYMPTDGWGDYDGDGVFEIATPGDLLAFQAYRQQYANYKGKTIVLTADIDLNPGWDALSGTVPTNAWKPIDYLLGVLDGQGHTIRGLYCYKTSAVNNDPNNASFLGIAGGANGGTTTIKNLTIENSYFHAERCGAGLVGYVQGGLVIENVIVEAYCVAEDGYAAGFAGYFRGKAETHEPSVTLTNCMFAGSVIASRKAGAFVGSNNRDDSNMDGDTSSGDKGSGTYSVTMTDCVNYGTVLCVDYEGNLTNRYAAGLIGDCANEATLTRCYNANGVGTALVNVTLSESENLDQKPVEVTLEDCYYIAGTDVVAMTKANSATATVTVKYDGVTATSVKSATPAELVAKTAFQASGNSKGWCLLGGEFALPVAVKELLTGEGEYGTPSTDPTAPVYSPNPNWGDHDGDGVFEIATPGDLLAMAKYRLDYANYEGCAVVLTADIDLNPGWDASSRTRPTNVWATMWNMKGTFDGQGHTISGIYSAGDNNGKNASFITAGIGGTVIQNLIIENSYFVSKDCSAFIACARGDVVMENVFIDAIVEATEGGAAGFVGWFYTSEASAPSVELTNCVFVGTVAAQTWAGGFVGTNQRDSKDTRGLGTYSVTLTDCANYGDIIANSIGMSSGLIGVCANEAILTRCYNAGYTDTALANLHTNNQYNDVTVTLDDCYYADGVSYNPINNNAIYLTTVIRYDGISATAPKSATPSALVAKAAFQASATSRGWDLYAGTAALPVSVIELLDGEGEYDPPVADPTAPVYSPNPNWGDHDGDGVFEIATPGDLLAMAAYRASYNNYLGYTIVLTADIDLNPYWDATTKTPATNIWAPCFYMKGTFDGQGHTIKGIYSTGDSNGENACLFVLSEGDSTVKDLKIENSYFHSSKNATGVFAAARGPLTIENVYVDAICECDNGSAAGFVTWFNCSSATMYPSVTLINCVFTGSVKGATAAAAFVGSNDRPSGNKGQGTYSVTLIDCANYGKITSSSASMAAGLIGVCANEATLIRCYNAGEVGTALVNLHTSNSENLLGTPVTVYLEDCYYDASASSQAITDQAPVTTVSVRYEGKDASEIKTATPTQIVTKEAFGETYVGDGWILTADGMAVPAAIGEFFDGGNVQTSPVYTPNMNWAPNANKVFEIATPGDLLAMADPTIGQRYNYYEGYTIILTADIDLNPGWDASSNTVPTNIWTPCEYMRGVLDGQGHTISGLYSTGKGSEKAHACFIRNTEGGCTLRNLIFENSYFYAEKEAAGLIGFARDNVLIENVLSGILCEVGFEGRGFAGGFVSWFRATSDQHTPSVTLKNCVFAGAVIAPKVAGAFVGTNDRKILYKENGTQVLDLGQGDYGITMIDCVNYGVMICMDENGDLAEDGLTGLIGECANNATLIRCYNAGITDAGLINVTKSDQTTTTQNDVVITLEDCYYYPELYTAGITKSNDAVATVVIKYDGIVATETQSATTDELLEKTAYKPSGDYKGWIGYSADGSEAIVFPVAIACMAGGHEFDDGVVTAPTCKEIGYTTYTCEICGYSHIGDRVPANGNHAEGDWIVDKEAGQCVVGQRHKECSVCGQTTRTEEIAMIPHDYTTVITAPTCQTQGYTDYTCKHCGDSYRGSYTSLPHTESDWIIDREADRCVTAGSRHKECTVCSQTLKTETIPAAAHDYTTVVTAPTCQTPGYTDYTCKHCGDSYRGSYIASTPTQHTESDWIVDRAATEYTSGSRHKECTVCKKQIKVEVIPIVDPCADGHDYESVVTKPTCQDKGYTTYTCKKCDDSYVSDYTETVGHTEGEWIVDKEPTEENAGIRHKECTVCKEILDNEIIPSPNSGEDGCKNSISLESALSLITIIMLGALALGKKRCTHQK